MPASPAQIQATIPPAISNFIFIVLMIVIFCIGVFIRSYHLGDVQVRSPDEGIYTHQAAVVAMEGSGGFKSLAREHKNDPRLWLYPPPYRVGYIWLLSSLMKAFGSMHPKVGAYLSFVCSILSLGLTVLIGIRFFNKWVALIALLFLSVSPMDLAIARRAWQDSLFGLLGLFLVYLAAEISHVPRKRWWYLIFVLTGMVCVTVKDSGLMVYGICVLWLIWVVLVKERRVMEVAFIIIASAAGLGLVFAVTAQSVGGFSAFIEIFQHWKEAIPTNQYAVAYETEPPLLFLRGFWLISPFGTTLCLVGVLAVLLRPSVYQKFFNLPLGRDRKVIIWIALFMMAFIASDTMPYFPNLRYVSATFGPFYLMAGLGIWSLVSYARSRMKNFTFILFVGCVVFICATATIRDYEMFRKSFMRTGILDTTIRLIEESLRIQPR